jgi:hypothetical protein
MGPLNLKNNKIIMFLAILTTNNQKSGLNPAPETSWLLILP